MHKLNNLDVIQFWRQLATLLSSGIAIIQAMDLLEKNQNKTAMQLLVLHIKRELLAGHSLFKALQKHPQYFSDVYCQLIKVAEATGKLDEIMQNIADTMEKNYLLQLKIKQAFFYPICIFIFAILITLGLLIFVIPRFAELFAETQIALPRFSLLLFSFSLLLRKYFFIILPICIIIMIASNIFWRHKLKTQIIKTLTTLPFIAQCIKQITLTRFVRQLRLIFLAGITLTDAMHLCANLSLVPDYRFNIIKLKQKLTNGLSLHKAILSTDYFPPFMSQMIKAGEVSGKLDVMLDKIAIFLEADTNQLISKMSQLLEPLIMIVLGVLIGGLVIGMYLPIFKLGNAL